MALSETGKWLEQALLKVCSNGGSGLELDSETLYSLVSYCEMAPLPDAGEYLVNIVGDDRCKDIVTEYLRRRDGIITVPEVGMQAYQKPREESWCTGSKKAPKQKAGDSEGSRSSYAQKDSDQKSPLYHGNAVLLAENIAQKGKRAVGKGKKGGKGISLAEASKGLVGFARGGLCNCLCTRHKLINNCLSCGRIVCEQEGEGPCHFCGALVLRAGSDYGGLQGLPVSPATEADALAEEFKNRLVEYDRTSASRTTVIDDHSDYFQIEANTWLSDKEKKLLQKRQDDEERLAEERRKRVVVTIDLLGRKVVMADRVNGKDIGERISILGCDTYTCQEPLKVSRVKPNVSLAEIPVFIDMGQSGMTSSLGTSDQRQRSSKRQSGLLKSGRIQHDDPLVEALIGHTLNDIGINEERQLKVWQGQKARALDQGAEDFECQAETAGLPEHVDFSTSTSTARRLQCKEKSSYLRTEESDQEPAFNICLLPGARKQKPVVLTPSILMQKQNERKEAFSEANSKHKETNRVLLPGMVLLKAWLSPDQQVDIVKTCHLLGIGPGGFYQPGYGDSSKMHLHMMCLGLQWEPMSKSYGPRRIHHDNAVAPSIPDSFLWLADKALSTARLVVTEASGGKSIQDVLDKHSTVPDMVPDLCIANFYEHTGNLGIHQDKDESADSLRKGCPVVSFSMGDSAEFIFSKGRDIEKAEKVILESGDVLIFGGPARMIYHGVSNIIAGTCPKWLSQRTQLRPGRLNLTLRQF